MEKNSEEEEVELFNEESNKPKEEEEEEVKNNEENDEDISQSKKKRKKTNNTVSYIDNEADEEDEYNDDDDDDDIGYEKITGNKTGNKKRKVGKNKYVSTFLDTEAQVGDEEDEEEYASSYVDEFEEAKRLEKKKLYETKLKSGTNHLAQAINKLSQRYENEKDLKDGATDDETLTDEEMSEDEEYFDEAEGLNAFDSPKMWLIKLFKNGAERHLAMGIYYKYMKLQSNDFNIKGIYVSDDLKGYIYIEADSLYMLKRFLIGFKFINLNEISIVPVQELTSIFAMSHSKVVIPKVNEYVRIKRGVYANDIGQIFEVHEKGIYAIVRLIPRILYDKYNNSKKDQYDNVGISTSVNKSHSTIHYDITNNNLDQIYPLMDKINTNNQINNGNNAIVPLSGEKLSSIDEALQIRRKKKKERPLKKLFDRDEIEQIGGVIEHGPYPGTIKYQNNIFEENGYLLKKMNIKYLISENANITLTEIRDFNKNNTNEEDINLHISKSFINKNSLHLFKKGERVKIMKGELFNLIGTITNINENVLSVNPDNLAKEFKFLPSDVTKYFTEGDNVTVINGLHKGKSGLISLLDYKENIALIFSPSLNTEFRSSIQDLTGTISSSNNTVEGLGGVNTLNGFSIGDLIELNDRQIGVLTYIDKNKHIRVLTNSNKILHTTIGSITYKRSAIGQICKDENGNIIQSKDTIQLIKGAHKNKMAIVSYIWKNKIFAKINKKIEDNGFVVVDCENCLLSGNVNEKKKIITQHNLFRNNNMQRKNTFQSFIGKTVKILSGVYKGLLADVIDAERDEFTLLLKIKPKTIRQKRIECAIADAYKDDKIFDDKNTEKKKDSTDKTSGTDFRGKFNYESRFDKNKNLEEDEERRKTSFNLPFYNDVNEHKNYDKRKNDRKYEKNNYNDGYNSYSSHTNKPNYYDDEKKKKKHYDNSNKKYHQYDEHENNNWKYSSYNKMHENDTFHNNKDEKNYLKNYKSADNMDDYYTSNKNGNTEQRNVSRFHNEKDKKYEKKKTSPTYSEYKKNDNLHEYDQTESQNNFSEINNENNFHKSKTDEKRDQNNKGNSDWIISGVIIKIVTPGLFYNEIGRIAEVIKKGSYTILKIETDKTSFNIVSEAVVPLKPNKPNDQVIAILDGGEINQGTIIDISNDNKVEISTINGNINCDMQHVFLYKKV
ncbi:transcription elongation factor SPT5, putative [Plasmodium berghei]|uniref:Transcription elongation factor SPT5 n=2 Tax=Plasmodium berghei TaxID=5821 RepID=A0A509ADX6_PLABA|nr:transcription elongation factor SPT5, putative [Plasmodium berghei ANKA]CXH82568.1 transcription elongation factor SPT5, putative [Plasmodium berghei]SCM19212.1 transcription elongation factor SPT5, putative [Plasmodium berghei]SCN21656.1 transcription elongation factor SPT5, putative [Plasmodium berghei]SCO58894.1 transcription elongation factor SPT5, putative [Plasmodium berghei]SCO58961.1 transcription elongation factor SPT5, putative [Plasmodium berghei]|eukprot:XP_034419692.1 transcription elongation factor SPT5, putative [Plasmodium berghei ANKA]